MTATTPVREHVSQAVDMEWPAFEARHPNLAGLLDQAAIVDRAVSHIADDPEYRRALDEATALGMTTETAVHFTRTFVHDWLARLLF